MMQYFNQTDVKELSKIYRLNLVNSITGYKSANMIGTRSKSGYENLAVFSSITHLGSDPALINFTMRPNTVPRDTYKNIKENGAFTVNHIEVDHIEDAHHTSAKYEEHISEFDQTFLNAEYKGDWQAPFVKGAPVQLGCRFLNEYLIKENGCVLIVAAIEHIYVRDEMVGKDGWVQLDKGNVVVVNGLDGYALPKLEERFEYARPKDIKQINK